MSIKTTKTTREVVKGLYGTQTSVLPDVAKNLSVSHPANRGHKLYFLDLAYESRETHSEQDPLMEWFPAFKSPEEVSVQIQVVNDHGSPCFRRGRQHYNAFSLE